MTTQDSERAGLAIADVLTLPAPLQQLVTWIVRQDGVSLTEVMTHTGEDEQTCRSRLYTLIQEGYIQAVEMGGITHYRRARLARKRERQLSENIWQSLAPGNPLAIIRNPSGAQTVVAGSSFELYVTVSNQGNQSALIDVYIDDVSQPLFQWCVVPRDRLALGPQQSGEVVFQFQVPTQALPGTYTYSLVVDAPQHYPEDTPIQHTQRLQVLPPVQEAVRVNDPTFTLQPPTSSARPVPLQPGQILEVVVQVHNRSDRVDRFRLTCPDLADSWFTVRYPEGLDTPGLIVATNGLDLNPGAKGQILVLLHPPLDAHAGTYSPNIQLHSANQPDLLLLDLVYFQLLPVYLVTVELRTRLGRVKRGAGQYEVKLINEGNTERHLQLRAGGLDEEDLCTYTLEPAQVWVLPPKTAASADLTIQPTKWWRRPFYGGGRLLNFLIEVEDTQQLPLPTDRFQGTLTWESRPWWQFLLLALTTLGTLAAIALLIWWVFFRPPANPKIVEFTSDTATYQEADGDFIRLNWQIRHPEQLKALRIVSQSPDGSASSKPLLYDFSQGIPDALKPFCVIQTVLRCQGVRTDARKVGNYVFELAVIPKRGDGDPSDTQKTSNISIQSEAPKILFFKINDRDVSANPKFLVAIDKKQPIKRVILSWQVTGGQDLKVELLPAPGTVNTTGAVAYTLTQRPSSETFTLKATNAAGLTVSRSITIENFDPTLPQPSPSPGNLPGSLLPPPPPGQTIPVVPIPIPPKLTAPTGSPATAPGSPPGGGASPAASPTAPPAPNPNAPAPSDPGTLSPSELPPQFN